MKISKFGTKKHQIETLNMAYQFVLDQNVENTLKRLTPLGKKILGRRLFQYYEKRDKNYSRNLRKMDEKS